jgi:hypothetical protein
MQLIIISDEFIVSILAACSPQSRRKGGNGGCLRAQGGNVAGF